MDESAKITSISILSEVQERDSINNIQYLYLHENIIVNALLQTILQMNNTC